MPQTILAATPRRRRRRLAPRLLLVLGLSPLLAPSAWAACPQGNVGALPVTVGQVKVRIRSSENISTTTPATQKNCIFLENVSAAGVSPIYVDSQLEEAGVGTAGPWQLVSSSSINISGGVPVTCSTSFDVARTEPTFGLAAGEVSDICCFTWEAEPPGGCSELPGPGDIARHTAVPGGGAEMQILSYVPTGGTTCGLVGLEVLPLALLARRLRRRS